MARYRATGTGLVLTMLVAVFITSAHAEIPLKDELVRGESKATIQASPKGDLRTYTLSSTIPLRDNLPENKCVVFEESPDQAVVRTGNVMFDGLYAMAVHEARQNSVSEIKDHAYSNGDPIRIEAFQTGEKWTYVWTRDLAYSVNLSLAAFDPQRSINSLLFKTSSLKPSVSDGFEHQIIQDTGSGGSYPVSTDRVVWALGAWETLKYLSGPEREAFLRKVYPVLSDTIEQDRILVYDPRDGLYRGEQSFLDWREQSYPGWTKDDVLPIALSKSLSVNVLNYYLLTVASECAERMHHGDDASRYAAWASDLKEAINRHFYDPDAGLYSAYLLSDGLCHIHAKRYDLLGESLAILFGVADDEQAAAIMKNYPVGPHGPSVVWPQERTVPIYHNQGIWPFVTAYWIKAARKVANIEALNHGVQTMERLAAFNLSNMENYDFVSGLADVRNKPLSGPVINSRRQLWSVAGYLATVQDVIFGLETTWDGIRFQPCITARLRNDMLSGTDVLELRNFEYRGTRNDVCVHLPPARDSEIGLYMIRDVTVNGEQVGSNWVPADRLKSANQWDVYLDAPESAGSQNGIRFVDTGDDHRLYGPVQPKWNEGQGGGITIEDDGLRLHYAHPDAGNVVFNIYRDGMRIASAVKETSWLDENAEDYETTAYCYTVEAVDPVNGNASHPTPFICRNSKEQQHVIPASEMKNRGGKLVNDHHFESWGEQRDELETKPFHVDQAGRYTIRTRFANGSGPVNTGITCAVKTMALIDDASGNVVASGYIIMPQSGSWERWDMSSPVPVELQAGKAYRIRIGENKYARNMSYLEQNERYTAWAGGGDEGYNYVNIASVHVDLLAAEGSGRNQLTSNP